MDDLRISLIIAGAFVLLAIYLWDKRGARRSKAPDTPGPLADDDAWEGEKKPAGADFVALFVNAPHGEFDGADLRYALTTQGLRYNPARGIFEYPLTQQDYGEVLFTVANMVNPGLFPDEKLENFTTVGIAFLMVLPVPGAVELAFDKMLQVANHVASQLNGRLLDQRHAVLTRQGINRMREQLIRARDDEAALKQTSS